MIELTLKEYLEEKKIPINFVHEVTQIRYATIWSYVHNKSSSIKLEHLAKIMEAINISDPSLIMKKVKK